MEPFRNRLRRSQKEALPVGEETPERDRLIAQAYDAGVASPRTKSDEELRAAIAAAGGTPRPQFPGDTAPAATDAELTQREAAVLAREQAADQAQVADEATAGTIDDPNVEDPYAHLRAKNEAAEDAADVAEAADVPDVPVGEETTERDQLIAQAQEAGVAAAWERTNEDLRAAIAAAGGTPRPFSRPRDIADA